MTGELVNQNKKDLNINVEYLQMIQSAIDRMSTSSAIFKGFAAAIVAGVSAISFGEVSLIVIILSFIPVLSFMMMDVYYLQLERRYRALFEMVRKGKYSDDYCMKAPQVKELVQAGADLYKVKLNQCIFSSSIMLFYFPIITICLIIIGLKIGGVC